MLLYTCKWNTKKYIKKRKTKIYIFFVNFQAFCLKCKKYSKHSCCSLFKFLVRLGITAIPFHQKYVHDVTNRSHVTHYTKQHNKNIYHIEKQLMCCDIALIDVKIQKHWFDWFLSFIFKKIMTCQTFRWRDNVMPSSHATGPSSCHFVLSKRWTSNGILVYEGLSKFPDILLLGIIIVWSLYRHIFVLINFECTFQHKTALAC